MSGIERSNAHWMRLLAEPDRADYAELRARLVAGVRGEQLERGDPDHQPGLAQEQTAVHVRTVGRASASRRRPGGGLRAPPPGAGPSPAGSRGR